MTPERAAPDREPVQVTLVHDYLTQKGGAERVVLAMSDAYPAAPIYTALYDTTGTYEAYAGRDVRTTGLNRVALLRRSHRMALPVLAPAFSALRVPGDLVLCSSSGWAHGVQTDGHKVVYCHSPAKWLYAPERYFAEGWPPARVVASALRLPLVRWDRAAAATASHYVVNSRMVQRWVQEVYGRDAEILPPPHGVDPDGPGRAVEGLSPGFVLCVSRLLPYKNVEAVVEAVSGLPDQQLVVVGTGPLAAELRARAPKNVTFVGRVDDAELRWLYRNSSAVVAAALEDFGLTPPEAAAFGKPVAVLRWGGFLDTVVEGVTGAFFDAPSAGAIRSVLRELSRTRWDEATIRLHAERYSPERFATDLRRIVVEQVGQPA
jgi:glycosyltransferase involved in cell wall biosynthesis